MYTVRDSYVGDGSTTQFGVTFPYMAQVHVYAEVDGVPVPRTFIGPSTVQITPAPAAGSVVLLYRQTDIDNLNYEFQLGAAFLPPYIDSNNKQLLYSVQESDTTARDATAAAADAGARADLATATANSALATAGTALSQSSTALSTANSAAAEASQAATDAAAAESSASAAQSAASAAQTAATAAQTAASSALTTAQTADTKATKAAADAAAALSTAGTANSTANAANATAGTALSTANTAAANASTALSTANGIDAKATLALSTAIAADAKADEALAALGEAGVASWNGRSGIVTPQAGDYSAAEVSRGVSNVDADLTALEAGKADTGHTHSMSDVTGLQTALDGKAPTVHGHAISDVTGLQAALDGKAAASHSHTISDVTGLQTALDAKVGKTGDFGAAYIPFGNTGQRPVASSGMLRVNTTTGLLEYVYLGNWYPLNIPTQTTNDNTAGRVIKNGDRQSIRAWVNFHGINGITIRGRFGISTVIRNVAGVYTIYFSQVFQNDWYACHVSSGRGELINNLVSTAIVGQFYDAVQVEVTRESNGNLTHVDAGIVQVIVVGEYNNA